MKVPKALTYSKVHASHRDLLSERSDWEAAWKDITNYLLPGRGRYDTSKNLTKRQVTNRYVVNPAGEEALYVLTSGMHGSLTSPSRPWFRLEWADADLNNFEPLKAWLQTCTDRLHRSLAQSNFYNVINDFYIEYAGFGTSCTFMGEDTDDVNIPFHFQLLTAGEFSFTTNSIGRPIVFARPLYMSPRQLVDMYPDGVSKELKDRVKSNSGGIDKVELSALEYVLKHSFGDKPFTRVVYETIGMSSNWINDETKKPLQIDGFYEWPYPLARWGTIGRDDYGIGPGSRALPHIKRLQEMEKAFMMAVHKEVDPPVNAPSRQKGNLNTLPGGRNWYSNPDEKIERLYDTNFNMAGVLEAIERVEERIKRVFFNDIFLGAMRDPNASPLRTGQVNELSMERMLRMGPVTERLQFEYLTQVVERGFNIMLRKGMMPELSPDLAQMASGYHIALVSPMATAQRRVALEGISSYMAFISQAAQFDQTIIDNFNSDEAAKEVADITGVSIGVKRPDEDVQRIRAERAKKIQAEKAKQEQMQVAGLQGQLSEGQATTAKTQSEAALNLLEAQETANQMGTI
jgi:hypothetical protein